MKDSFSWIKIPLLAGIVFVIFGGDAGILLAAPNDIISPPEGIPPIESQPPAGYAEAKKFTPQTVINILGQIRDFTLVVGILFIVVMIVWAGISYVMAGGSEEGTEAAKGKLVGALIAAAVILGVYILIMTITTLIGEKSLI